MRSHQVQGQEAFVTYTDYVAKHGEVAAMAMRTKKKELERKRDPKKVPIPYWKKNPDADLEEMGLFRVFQAHTITRRDLQEQSETMSAKIDLDGDQTRDLLPQAQCTTVMLYFLKIDRFDFDCQLGLNTCRHPLWGKPSAMSSLCIWPMPTWIAQLGICRGRSLSQRQKSPSQKSHKHQTSWQRARSGNAKPRSQRSRGYSTKSRHRRCCALVHCD